MKEVFLVFIGGGVGSVARYLLGRVFNNPADGIPYGTFIANILGSFLIGLILGYAMENENLTEGHSLLLATGFCGGFTTFSTFAYENHVFLKSGDFLTFGMYTIASFTIGFMAVFFGMYLVKFFA